MSDTGNESPQRECGQRKSTSLWVLTARMALLLGCWAAALRLCSLHVGLEFRVSFSLIMCHRLELYYLSCTSHTYTPLPTISSIDSVKVDSDPEDRWKSIQAYHPSGFLLLLPVSFPDVSPTPLSSFPKGLNLGSIKRKTLFSHWQCIVWPRV